MVRRAIGPRLLHDAETTSPGNVPLSPGNGALSAGNMTYSPGSVLPPPGNGALSPGNGGLPPDNKRETNTKTSLNLAPVLPQEISNIETFAEKSKNLVQAFKKLYYSAANQHCQIGIEYLSWRDISKQTAIKHVCGMKLDSETYCSNLTAGRHAGNYLSCWRYSFREAQVKFLIFVMRKASATDIGELLVSIRRASARPPASTDPARSNHFGKRGI